MTVSLELVLAKLSGLPTLPGVADKVGLLVNDPDSTSREIAQVVKRDQSLTARLLALVNSAYFGVPGGVSSVERAISYLGYNTVYQLVLTVSVFDVLPSVDGTAFSVKDLWKHSLGCAIASETLARHLRHSAPEELFTAGLLHDIGKVVLASFFASKLEEIVQHAARDGTTFSEKERDLGFPAHDYIGRCLADKWSLPAVLRAGIGYHHVLDIEARVGLPRHLCSVADIVALGDVLCRRCRIGNSGDEVTPEPDAMLMDRLNLTDLALSKLQDEVPRVVERSKPFLDLLE